MKQQETYIISKLAQRCLNMINQTLFLWNDLVIIKIQHYKVCRQKYKIYLYFEDFETKTIKKASGKEERSRQKNILFNRCRIRRI